MLVYILSTARTGGTFVLESLSNLGFSGCNVKNDRILRLFNNSQNSILKKIGNRLIKRHLERISRLNHFQVEYNPQIPNFIENILENFPNTIFIHQIRDPRDWIKSMVNWTITSPIKKFFSLYVPFWVLRPDSYHLGADSLSKIFENYVLTWNEKNKTYSNLKFKTNNYFLLKYEDLKANPLSFIKEVLKICGYSNFYSDEAIKKAMATAFTNPSKNFIDSWETWDDKYICFLHRQCEDLMKEYGYGNEKKWQERVSKSLNYGK